MNRLLVLLCFAAALCLIGCTRSDATYTKLSTFLAEHGRTIDGVETVLVLTDEGCPNCNRSFALLIADHLADPHTCVIVSAAGQRFDLAALVDRNAVLWDDADAFKDLGLLPGSGAILLQNGQVDSVITIAPQTIEATLGHLSERLR